METPARIIYSKYYLIWKVLPVLALFVLVKIILHAMGWEPFAPNLMSLFTTALAGIVFVLGFILAGVFADYKESERIPGDLACSLDAIWQETEILLKRGVALQAAQNLREKILSFIGKFREEFLVNKNDSLIGTVESFSDEFALLFNIVPDSVVSRLQDQQTDIVRMLNRIKIIRDTSFSESAQVLTRALVILFTLSILLLRLNQFVEGIFQLAFFIFVLASILFLIEDTDNPFEYFDLENDKKDEIDFYILYEFRDRVLRMQPEQSPELKRA